MLAPGLGASEGRAGGAGPGRRSSGGIAWWARLGPKLHPIGVLLGRQLQVGIVAVVHRARLPDHCRWLRTLRCRRRVPALREGGDGGDSEDRGSNRDVSDHARHSCNWVAGCWGPCCACRCSACRILLTSPAETGGAALPQLLRIYVTTA